MPKPHKTISQQGFLVRRQLRVRGLDKDRLSGLANELIESPNIDHIEFDARKGRFEITYDASRWCLDDVITVVRENGGDVIRSGWQRMKLGWYRSTDDNVRANAEIEPFCCSKMPPMKKK